MKSLVGARVSDVLTGCCEQSVKRIFAPSSLRAIALVGLTFLLFVFFLTIFLPQSAYAAEPSPSSFSSTATYELNPKLAHESTLACAALNGSWSNSTSTCTLSSYFVFGSGRSIKVEEGATLNITDTLFVDSGSKLVNFGNLIIKYALQNHGTIDNHKGGFINNPGTINPYGVYGGNIDNSGTINNYNGGTILNTRSTINGGTITNNGTIINNYGGQIVNEERIENYGNITNKGIINNVAKISNYGTINNYNSNSRIYNMKIRFEANRAVITNYDNGLIINSAGLIFNLGRIETQGRIASKGLIDNYGSITNTGEVINNSTGAIVNHSSGTIDNKGTVNNFGNVTVVYGAFSNVGGSFQNDCGGVVYGAVSGSPVLNACTLTTTTTTVSITVATVTASIERVASPDIYAWAVSATIAAVVLAIILLRRRG